ncbi:MAG TPA: hypothetical protein K8V56_15205, partial [Sporosarcina psychrophila]|nr:hypothetical protein [Sporosarcina psychrophila]
CSWTIRKAQAPWKTRKALEGLKRKAFFAFNLRTEATRGARRCSWTVLQFENLIICLFNKKAVPVRLGTV